MKYKVTLDNNLCEQNRVCEAESNLFVFDSTKGQISLPGSIEIKDSDGNGTNVFEKTIELDEEGVKKLKAAVVGCPKAAIKMESIE